MGCIDYYFRGEWVNLFIIGLLTSWLLESPAQAQLSQSYSNWYFGESAGVTFSGGTRRALTDGNLHTREGCASVSDEKGQLLFYTDGSTIWNRNHTVMPGATGLGGSSASTQSALIVPYQNSTGRFYVFSVSPATGVQYAIVNMTLAGGMGGLETKNKVVTASSTEKITAIRHCNNLNNWIITHEKGNNVFRVNLLNDNGLIPDAAQYAVGSVHQQNKGYMKPSHDGKKLAVAVSDGTAGGFLEVLDFDNKTGAISNAVKLTDPAIEGAYGVEFSGDNTLIYLSTLVSKKIYQISADKLVVNATVSVQLQQNSSKGVGALQLAVDGRIYGALPGEEYLMAITQPNQAGPGCGLVSQGIYLGGRTSAAGLPFVLDEQTPLPPAVTVAVQKLADCNKFQLDARVLNLDLAYIIYQWYVDGNAVAGATGASLQPMKSGRYSIKIRETKCRDIQLTSAEIPVTLVDANPKVTAVPDSCGTFSLVAHATGGVVKWTGPGIEPARSQLDSIIVSSVSGSQTYQVRVSSRDDSTCFTQKSVPVSFRTPPPYQILPSDRSKCGDTLVINAPPTSDWNTFRWQLPDGSSLPGSAVTAQQSGIYHLMALSTATGCKSESDVYVSLHPNPVINLPDRKLDTCFTTNPSALLRLDAGAVPNGFYTWVKEGAVIGNSQLQTVDDYGVYRVTVRTPAGCMASDSVRILSSCPPLPPMLSMPDAFSPNGDGMNEDLVIYASGIDQANLSIYNRWGEVVYTISEATPASSGWHTWDGTYRGQPVEGGTYTYRLELTSGTLKKSLIRQGMIQVVR
ncbi:gliding motility-associated C-terminal domain-containing protein [Spirosoma sp.]|uniref:T9SS type B sorting domain-containing protein n=1 Tax=Spirosoma sp. TaxID=1899569 RepID=UPI0026364679|nr:gliding motility-associated C-terminal domain-containing protein [Spirosoma sp.]MCX6216197.1 gliding motility-associated C-terminal domain-containing protein [Spirosoma sp.]